MNKKSKSLTLQIKITLWLKQPKKFLDGVEILFYNGNIYIVSNG